MQRYKTDIRQHVGLARQVEIRATAQARRRRRSSVTRRRTSKRERGGYETKDHSRRSRRSRRGRAKDLPVVERRAGPWRRDVRDCYCHCWASNHPDFVCGEIAPGEPRLPDGKPSDPRLTLTRRDGLHAERSPAMSAFAQDSLPGNRPTRRERLDRSRMANKMRALVPILPIRLTQTPAWASRSYSRHGRDRLAGVA